MKSPLSLPLPVVVCLLTVMRGSSGVELDPSFQATIPNGTVHALVVNSQGEVFAGGEFSSVNGQNVPSVAKLTVGGALDPSFSAPRLQGGVLSLAQGSDGTLRVGGSFGAAALGDDGTVRYNVAANGRVESISLGTNNKLVIGGTFWSQPDVFATRVNGDGTVDAGFRSGLKLNFSMEAGVTVVAFQGDGKILVGGNFNTDAGFTTLARLNSDGSVDESFSRENGFILYAKAIRVLPDGKILIGGTADASGRGFVRVLNADGGVDSGFTEASLDGAVEAVAVDGDGKIVIGGSFTSVNGVRHERLARLNADGSLDASWTVGANNVVKTIAYDKAGGVLVGGAFSEIGGVARSGIARLKEGTASLSSADGEVQLSLQGEPGRSYVIESSNDLKTWQELGTHTATAEGVTVNANTRTEAHQFFRARAIE